MTLETFDDVIASMKRNRDRPFHVLLGNGFSMAYDSDIFSYNALHEFVAKLDDDELSSILFVVDTSNFELIMQQLATLSLLVEVLRGDALFRAKIDRASEKLKKNLLAAVESLHPPHVFSVPEEESRSCAAFLDQFLQSGGSIFSTNYDLLLYWVLMRNDALDHIDGFGRDLENGDEYPKPEDQIWSELRWGKHRATQNTYYLHGALHLFDTGPFVVKEEYDDHAYLLEKINARLKAEEYPVFVTAGDGEEKLSRIMHNHYLSNCYDRFASIEGSLVTFGFNFGPYDDHLIDAINRAAKHGRKDFPKLLSVYVGVYSKEDKRHLEEIESRFMCKVHIYDARTATIWRET